MAFGLGKLFRRKVAVVAQVSRRMENEQQVQAVIAAAVLGMWADGKAEDSERDKVRKVLANADALAGFEAEVQQLFNKYDTIFKDVGFLAGKTRMLREISDVKLERQDAEDVFIVFVTVLASDGEVSDKEKEVGQEVGNVLGLRLENYLKDA